MDLKLNNQLYALLNKLDAMGEKMYLVRLFTNNRTASVTEMTTLELKKLIASLQEREEREMKPMRGKVIHYLCLLGYVTMGGGPDYVAMNAHIERLGTTNPRKKQLFGLSKSELRDVLTQIEQRYKKQVQKQ